MLVILNPFQRCGQFLAIGFTLLVSTALLPGCGPAVSTDELGKIVYEVPAVPGADKPYKLPGSDVRPAEHSHGGSAAHAVSTPPHDDAAGMHVDSAPSHPAPEPVAPKHGEQTLEEMLGLAPKSST